MQGREVKQQPQKHVHFLLKLLGWWCMKQIRWDEFLLGFVGHSFLTRVLRQKQSVYMSSLFTSLLGIMGNIGRLQQLSLSTSQKNFHCENTTFHPKEEPKKIHCNSLVPFFHPRKWGTVKKNSHLPGPFFFGGSMMDGSRPIQRFSRIIPWVTLAMKNHHKSNEKNKGP